MSESVFSPSSVDVDRDIFLAEWQEWHAEQDRRRLDPRGVLACTALAWLTPVAQRVHGAPGLWRVRGDDVVVEVSPGDVLFRDGAPLEGEVVLGPVGTLTLTFPAGEIELSRRGAHVIARPRRADNPFLRAFRGTETFPPDAAWRIEACFEPAPDRRRVDAAVEGFQHELEVAGVLRCRLLGVEHALTVFATGEEGRVRLPFRDAGGGTVTPAVGRTVFVPVPRGGGPAVIDFTRASNPPCAYSDFGTCPLPPAENRLPLLVAAGEKSPAIRLTSGADGEPIVVHVDS